MIPRVALDPLVRYRALRPSSEPGVTVTVSRSGILAVRGTPRTIQSYHLLLHTVIVPLYRLTEQPGRRSGALVWRQARRIEAFLTDGAVTPGGVRIDLQWMVDRFLAPSVAKWSARAGARDDPLLHLVRSCPPIGPKRSVLRVAPVPPAR